MKGSILQLNKESGSGLISGDDGQRYEFDASSVSGDFAALQAGAQVDFVGVDGKAIDIIAMPTVAGDKNRIMAAVLAFFLGAFGVHKFYLGKKKAGIIMLVVSLLGFVLLAIPTMIMGLIAFIEFVVYLIKSDAEFQAQYIDGDKSWF